MQGGPAQLRSSCGPLAEGSFRWHLARQVDAYRRAAEEVQEEALEGVVGAMGEAGGADATPVAIAKDEPIEAEVEPNVRLPSLLHRHSCHAAEAPSLHRHLP